MRRLAIVWAASLAAAFLAGRTGIRERVTVERAAVGPAAAPSVATCGLGEADVRRILREELGEPAAPPPGPAVTADPAPAPTPAPAPAPSAAFLRARDVLAQGMADGRWSAADRDALNAALDAVSPEQRRELLSALFPAVNDGRLVVDAEPIL